MLIEAFAAAAQRDPSLHLVMAGPDEENLKATLTRQAHHLGCSHRITWTGMLDGALKWGALQAAEAFALFSHQENFGGRRGRGLGKRGSSSDYASHQHFDGHRSASCGFRRRRHTGRCHAFDAPLVTIWINSGRSAMRERAKQCFRELFHSDAATRRLVDEMRQRMAPTDPVMHASGRGNSAVSQISR